MFRQADHSVAETVRVVKPICLGYSGAWLVFLLSEVIIMDKNLEDMDREERQQFVDNMKRRQQEWIDGVPLSTPEQSAGARVA